MKNTTEDVTSVCGTKKLYNTVHWKAFEETFLHCVKGNWREESFQRRESWIDCELLCWHLGGEKQKLQTQSFFARHKTLLRNMKFYNFFISIGHLCGLAGSFEICTVGFLYRLTVWGKTFVALRLILKYLLHSQVSWGGHYMTTAPQSIFTWGTP